MMKRGIEVREEARQFPPCSDTDCKLDNCETHLPGAVCANPACKSSTCRTHSATVVPECFLPDCHSADCPVHSGARASIAPASTARFVETDSNTASCNAPECRSDACLVHGTKIVQAPPKDAIVLPDVARNDDVLRTDSVKRQGDRVNQAQLPGPAKDRDEGDHLFQSDTSLEARNVTVSEGHCDHCSNRTTLQ